MNSDLKTKPGAGTYTLYLLWATACFIFFQFWYSNHFFYQEQNQLFLWSKDYLVTYLNKPGWFACMVGDFLTQFYYYPYVGASILTLIFLWIAHDVRRGLKVAGVKTYWITNLASFIVITLLAILSLNHEYRLSNLLAVWGGVNVFLASTRSLGQSLHFIRKIEHMEGDPKVPKGTRLPHMISVFNIIITIPVCHWFFGSGVLTYCLFVLIGCLNYIMLPYNYLRLGGMVIMMFILLLGKRLYFVNFSQLYNYPSLGKFVKPELERERTYAVDFEYYRGNYNKVIDIVLKEKNPNQYMKFYYNLVVAQNKGLSDNLLKYPDNCLGTFEAIGPGTSNLTSKSLGELYWLLGDMTFAERAAILSNINSPSSRNIRQIKRLAEINLVTGEQEAAKKYLRMLQKTFVWRRWADRVFAAMGKNATAEERATIQPYLDKQKFVNTRDTIRNNDNCYTIMKELVESNPSNNMAVNYLLCTDLLLKNLQAFKYNYDHFYLKQKSVLYDPLYQQALMLYLDKTHAPAAEWNKYIKRPNIQERYRQYKEQPGSEAFSNTYWYYYDKAKTPQLKYETSK